MSGRADQGVPCGGKVGGNRRLAGHPDAAFGVADLQPEGVQHHPRYGNDAHHSRPSIAGVAEEWRAEVGEVHADLVGASGLGPCLDQGHSPGPTARVR